MALEQTVHQFGQMINLMVENTQVVIATVFTQVIMYSSLKFKQWWSKQ